MPNSLKKYKILNSKQTGFNKMPNNVFFCQHY